GSYHGLFPNGGKDPAYQELYTRMFQFGAFCPIFRAHGSETPREIWEFGKYSGVLADFDRLRYRLMPYIYSNAWRVTNEGYTLMRGLAMDFSGDSNTYRIADQFMFGPSLMVCPVTDVMEHRPPEASVPVAPGHFRTGDGRPGLDVVYFGDDHFGTPVHYGTEPDIALDWYAGWPSFIHRETFSMRWEGTLIPSETGPHRFHFKTFGPRLITIDGQPLKLDYVSVEAVTEPVNLVAGRSYRFTCATSNGVLGAFRAQLYWFTPSQLEAKGPSEPRPRTRDVYLPRGGDWFDFWTGASRPGGRSITADAPIEKIPLLVPAGSIIPLGPPIEYAAEKPDAPLEVRIYPGADASFTLYDDEGDSYDYEKGAHATIAFNWSEAGHRLTMGARSGGYPGMPAQREFRIVIVRPGHGAGPGDTPAPDRIVRYSGSAQTLQF
ncbi:MAG TPA: DUF5110 domain-containing protein, partial [Opitutaceae bacterium]|nr:DUF5110 domain-containing protein [Opitutaceae bacterium]